MAKTKQTNDDEAETDISPIERRYNIYAAISFVALMLLIGLPQWWRTTRVYRASLPYSDIYQFNDAVLILPVSISIIAADDKAIEILRQDNLASKIKTEVSKEFYRLRISLDLSERQASDAERSILSSDYDSLEELEKALYVSSISKRGPKIHSQDIKGNGLEIFVLHRPSDSQRVYFGSGTRVFIIGDLNGSLRGDLFGIFFKIIFYNYLRIEELLETVNRHTKHAIRTPFNDSRTASSSRVLHPKVTLEMHVVDPEPIVCSQRFISSEIMDDEVVEGFLSSVRDVTDIDVKSQMLYYVDFNHEPIYNKKDGFHYLNPLQLRHMINPIETYLGTVVTSEPVYHMLFYLPPVSTRPLMVPLSESKSINDALRPAPYNSFVVSGWGSVTVVNGNRSCAQDGSLLMDPMSIKETKIAAVANLRKFFDLRLPAPFERSRTSTISDWEIHSLRYRALVEYTFSSMNTLSSLTRLLGEVTNIVINDDIAASIGSAVSEINKVLNAPVHDGYWRVHSMLESSKHAFLESEKAFFDPSLLAMLYFPDDQKYAIYVPLFLPIGVPVLGSILFIYNYFKRNRLEKDKKE